MATLTVNPAAAGSSTGLSTLSLLAATSSNGDSFLNTGKEVVLFQNSSSQGAAAVTVTIAGQKVDNFGGASSLHNVTVSVPTSSMALTVVGPFRTDVYNDSNNKVQMTYSAAGLYATVVSIAPQS